MSDIGLLPAGSNLFFPAALLLVLGGLVALGATLQAALRARRLRRPMLGDPALVSAGAGGVMALLSLVLAVGSANATLETRQALDDGWLECVGTVVAATVLAGWGGRRILRR